MMSHVYCGKWIHHQVRISMAFHSALTMSSWPCVVVLYGEGQIQYSLIHLSPVKRHLSDPNKATVISEANDDWSKSTIPQTMKAWSTFSARLSLVSDMVKPNETGGV